MICVECLHLGPEGCFTANSQVKWVISDIMSRLQGEKNRYIPFASRASPDGNAYSIHVWKFGSGIALLTSLGRDLIYMLVVSELDM